MKCLIVCFHSESMTPYSKQYENVLKELNIDYDIVFWDRFSNGRLEKVGNKYTLHKICSLSGNNKIKKILPMIYYRSILKKIITNGNYEKIIVLNTLPGVLLCDVLFGKYKDNYILDIRDHTYENYKIYRSIVDKLVKNSNFSTISSDGFRNFLNKSDKLFLNHNISNLEKSVGSADEGLRFKKNIKIGYVGVIRWEQAQFVLLQSIKNDKRYTFNFYGDIRSDCKLKEKCNDLGYCNVNFYGRFDNSEKPLIYRNIDVINSMFSNKTINGKNLLPNRLYDALVFRKPIIVPKDTYSEIIVNKYGIGISVSEQDNVVDIINEYILNFDYEQFNKRVDVFLNDVLNDQKVILENIKKFLIT